MPTGTDADFAFLQKILFPQGPDNKALVKDKLALANTPHKKNFATGRGMEVPAPYSTPQGASSQAATAAANASPSKGSSFLVPQTSYFAQLRLDGKLVANAKNGSAETQYIDQMKYESDMVEDTIGWELERQIFGSQTGYRGQIGSVSIGANTTITLKKITDAVFFRVNTVIVLAQVGGGPGGAIRNAGTTNKATVNAVNTKTGVLTFTGQNFTTLFGTAVADDYIYRDGDAQSGGTAKVAQGLEDWCPSTDPSATLYNGVDRSLNPSELAGVRYDGTLDQLETVFINARANYATQIGKGLKKGVFYIHPLYGAGMRAAYESKRIVETSRETTYKMGIDSFKIDNNEFIEAPACPYGISKFVSDGSFIRASCGDQPDWGGMGKSDVFWLDRDTDLVKGMMRNYGNFAAWRVNEMMHIDLPQL
jgi:hypothetical protein